MNQNQQSVLQSNDAIPKTAVSFASGHIMAVSENGFTVSSDNLLYKAERAFDCLMQPEVGDLVLMTLTPEGNFISQILSRPTEHPSQLVFNANIEIAAKGTISLNGQNGIRLQTPAELEVSSEKLTVNNLSTRFRTLMLLFQAREAESNIGRMKVIAEWIEQKAETIRQRFTRSDRVVKEADQQQAGSLVQRVDKTASLRAEHTIIKARKDVQVDGKRIHMG